MLVLSVKQWTKIRKRLKEEYSWKPSIFMIREVMRKELGFTTRYHTTWSQQRGTEEVICLDFYNESAESYFRLKYL